MAAWLDNCRFNPTAGGTTDWTFSSAVLGYQTPTLAGATNGLPYKFIAISADQTKWEIAEGAYNSVSGVFARTTVLYNSLGTGTAAGQSGAGTKISFTGAPQVAIIAVKEDLVSVEEANSFTPTQQAQIATNIGTLLSGTLMLFQQSTAPVGWTKQTTHNDKALRVVSGAASSGGTNAFSTVMAQTTVGNHTQTTTDMASHAHTESSITFPGGGTPIQSGSGLGVQGTTPTTSFAGGNGAHNHPITMSIQYVDLIICQKN